MTKKTHLIFSEVRVGFEKKFRKRKLVKSEENEEEKRIRKSLQRKQLNKEVLLIPGILLIYFVGYAILWAKLKFN